jgi:hypothetical protein
MALPPPTKYELVANVHDWAKNKLCAGERMQVLLVSNHPDGKRMSKYEFQTLEEALDRCQAELAGDLSSAMEYALVYDAFLKDGENTQPALVFRMEDRESLVAAQFVQRYELRKGFFSSKTTYRPLHDFRALAGGPKWLT